MFSSSTSRQTVLQNPQLSVLKFSFSLGKSLRFYRIYEYTAASDLLATQNSKAPSLGLVNLPEGELNLREHGTQETFIVTIYFKEHDKDYG